MLGMLQLRKDLPPAGHRSAALCRHHAPGSSTYPMRGTDSIMWTIKFRDQKTIKRFKFPIRTTAEGSIDCFKGFTLPSDLAALKQPGFYTGAARKE